MAQRNYVSRLRKRAVAADPNGAERRDPIQRPDRPG
jgi:hypothetical protein